MFSVNQQVRVRPRNAYSGYIGRVLTFWVDSSARKFVRVWFDEWNTERTYLEQALEPYEEKGSTVNQKLVMGRIVHFVYHRYRRGATVDQSDCVPALINHVQTGPGVVEGTVNLHVFSTIGPETETIFRKNDVKHGAREVGTWHWPDDHNQIIPDVPIERSLRTMAGTAQYHGTPEGELMLKAAETIEQLRVMED